MLDKAGPDVPRQMRYLSSHPLTSERIDRLQELARALPAASSRDPAGPGLAGAGYPALLPGTDRAAIAAACHGDR
jgi:predicted Zn-dependent protease